MWQVCSKCVVKIGEIDKINENSPILAAIEIFRGESFESFDDKIIF